MSKSIVKNIQRSILIFLILTLAGCNFPTTSSSPSSNSQNTSTGEYQQTLITFTANLHQPLPAGDSIYLTLLDEVTGLSFNSHRYILQANNALQYSVTIPFAIGMVIKYRYSREGAVSVNEHLYNDRPVRYRLYHVEGPATVQDVITQWTDTAYTGPRGRTMGVVLDSSTGEPVPNLLVTAGGEQAYTLADGSFLLEGLPPGIHNMVFYALDGSYSIFQQGAVIAADSTTPVSIRLAPTRLVTVIFTLKAPTDTPPDAPLRLAGNLYQLGNTFADLSGGVSTLASRMPVMGKLPDGRYMLTLNLPAGTYLQYKYTLGDGLWSSEVTSKGETRLRTLIVPNEELEQNDTADAWLLPGTKPITFEVKVPADTPTNEIISIQFNPGFGWLEPLPMWKATNASDAPVWRFDLTGPFNQLSTIHYRYCRQYQCGAADDSQTTGIYPVGRVVDPAANPGVIQDTVASWAWLSEPGQTPSIGEVQVTPREPGFIAAIALQANYHPSWGAVLSELKNDLQSLGVNSVILRPTWTFTNNTPPILEPLPSQDMLYPELIDTIDAAERSGLQVGIFPTPHFSIPASQWWQNAIRDFPWWVSFFERYSNFIMHHAVIASKTNADVLILGGDWLKPALPGGVLADGSPSNVPQDAETRWRELIKQVRDRYAGTLAWALPYPEGIKNPPPFLDAVDQVYILWSAPLANQPNTPVEDMQSQAAAIFDTDILPFQQQIGKPVIIAISYPAIDRAAEGCIAIEGGGCLDYDLLNLPNTDITALALNLQEQANAYNAVLTAINDRSWISGCVSMGYYPPAILQDKSTSIHGKPASGVFWYWTQKYLGR